VTEYIIVPILVITIPGHLESVRASIGLELNRANGSLAQRARLERVRVSGSPQNTKDEKMVCQNKVTRKIRETGDPDSIKNGTGALEPISRMCRSASAGLRRSLGALDPIVSSATSHIRALGLKMAKELVFTVPVMLAPCAAIILALAVQATAGGKKNQKEPGAKKLTEELLARRQAIGQDSDVSSEAFDGSAFSVGQSFEPGAAAAAVSGDVQMAPQPQQGAGSGGGQGQTQKAVPTMAALSQQQMLEQFQQLSNPMGLGPGQAMAIPTAATATAPPAT
ncbi:unnamed protein product, partial [Prorocentrum cordatum]